MVDTALARLAAADDSAADDRERRQPGVPGRLRPGRGAQGGGAVGHRRRGQAAEVSRHVPCRVADAAEQGRPAAAPAFRSRRAASPTPGASILPSRWCRCRPPPARAWTTGWLDRRLARRAARAGPRDDACSDCSSALPSSKPSSRAPAPPLDARMARLPPRRRPRGRKPTPLRQRDPRARRGAGRGFRPFVYRLAQSSALYGWVFNDAEGVAIEVAGPGEYAGGLRRSGCAATRHRWRASQSVSSRRQAAGTRPKRASRIAGQPARRGAHLDRRPTPRPAPTAWPNCSTPRTAATATPSSTARSAGRATRSRTPCPTTAR